MLLLLRSVDTDALAGGSGFARGIVHVPDGLDARRQDRILSAYNPGHHHKGKTDKNTGPDRVFPIHAASLSQDSGRLFEAFAGVS